jgi:UDP-N-acetylglucosamine--N-acetylmuramyl-(pentapeptide) pyrophosphoryl-undecaprenol N-acetylglucosamine transferase
VLGGGGYVAGPMVFAAWLRRIPAALTEADAHLGLANRLGAPFVRRVFLAYPVADREPPKYEVVGRPITGGSELAQADARRLFDLPETGAVVLVAGGSQGARSLNEAAVEAWGRNGGGVGVLHLAGERDYASLVPHVTSTAYRLFPFVDDFGAALAAADLVVSRAGGTVWEIAAAGKPAILVPYPHATGNHQQRNAEYFVDAGGALLVDDGAVHEDVPRLVAELLDDSNGRLQDMGRAMRAAAKPDAADRIADELIALAAARR